MPKGAFLGEFEVSVMLAVAAPLPVQGGRARKCFRLTPAGQRELDHSTAMLTRMMAAVRPASGRTR